MDVRYSVIDTFCHLLKKNRRFPRGYDKDKYLAHMNSYGWRIRKSKVLELRDFKCELCGKEKDLKVHHMAYGNIEKEEDYELSVLCKSCHTTSHFLTKNKISLPSPSVNRQILSMRLDVRSKKTKRKIKYFLKIREDH